MISCFFLLSFFNFLIFFHERYTLLFSFFLSLFGFVLFCDAYELENKNKIKWCFFFPFFF
jgi:hypothetical protein